MSRKDSEEAKLPSDEGGTDHDASGRDPEETIAAGSIPHPPSPGTAPTTREALPDRIGPYRILERLGQGGFGVVYRAEQRGAIRRQVAVKVIKAGMDTKQVLARFDAEKNALSLMSHPNIARVLDSGETAEGRPYFAMEYVDGTPITSYCQREKLVLEDRLRLFQQVCRGVQHAHTKAVVHRDLKPGNILVTREDEKPTVKIIDFGLAKALAQPLTDMTVVTEQRQLIGTLEYMSPEQAKSAGSDVDTKTDVYSLGMVLYELLVDTQPFENLRTRTDAEIIHVIGEQDPPRPSQRVGRLDHESLSRIAGGRGLEPHRLLARLRGELDWIVMKAIEKQRERRYETPLDLAADIERHLRGEEAIEARPPSVGYRMQKFARRYRRGLAFSMIVLVALTVGMAWAVVERNDAIRSKEQVLRLSDMKLLSEYVEEAKALWPAVPEKIDALNAWLDKARALQARLPLHVLALQQMRIDSGADSETETVANAWQRETLARLVEQLSQFASGGALADVEDRLEWATQLDALTVSGPAAASAWEDAIASISDPTECPLYDGLVIAPQFGLFPLDKNPQGLWEFWHLLSGQQPLPNPNYDPEKEEFNRWVITEDTGIVFVLIPGGSFRMGAERPPVGLEFDPPGVGMKFDPSASSLRVSSVVPGSLADRATLQVGDQLESVQGNATRTLFDFDQCLWTLATGSPATFVVDRGGEKKTLSALVEIGFGSPHVNPGAELDEAPVHLVSLRAYFLSKYEMTQGQWLRSPAEIRDPSVQKKGYIQKPDPRLGIPNPTVDRRHPVEHVSWDDCQQTLVRFGLSLPNETQWERGYRAGTTTRFWSGDRLLDLQGKANFGDHTYRVTLPGREATLNVNDGWVAHAPIGSFEANPFGLHDIHGNVWEWTRTSNSWYGVTPVSDEDGARGPGPEIVTSHRVARGGGFKTLAGGASARLWRPPTVLEDDIGVRPAKMLDR